MKNFIDHPVEIRMLLLLGVVCAAGAVAPYAACSHTVVLLVSHLSGAVAAVIESELRLSHIPLLVAYRASSGPRRRWIAVLVGANVVFFSTGLVALALWSRLTFRIVAA